MVDEGQINDLINKTSDIKNKDKKNTYIDSEIDKFLKDYRDKNINISYDKLLNQKKLLNHLINYIIN